MRTALITGALGGIGVALCEEFRRAGYFVIATDRKDGECTCDHFLNIDVRDLYRSEETRESVRAAVAPLVAEGGLHVLVNNAASQILNRTDDIKISDWDET